MDEKDPTSPWLTGRPKALKAVRKILGQSDYTAHEGVNSGGANAVYWVNIVSQNPDGTVLVSNITEGAKKEVESITTAIEPDLLYPLLRGRDVKKWRAKPSAYIIMAQDPIKRRGIDEDEMKTKYPRTYLYLKRFEKELRERAAFKRYFTRKDKSGHVIETGPFYSMFDVGDYTFASYKVVWPNMASELEAAVISQEEGKVILPQHIVTLVGCSSRNEGHYICALVNSQIANFGAQIYSMKGGKSFGDPHILKNIRIPKFDPQNKLHLRLAELSEKAHELAKKDDQEAIQLIEEEIDEISAQIWGLSSEEMKEIKLCFKEIS